MEILTSGIAMQACKYTPIHTIKFHVAKYNPLWQLSDNLKYEQQGQQAYKYEWNMITHIKKQQI